MAKEIILKVKTEGGEESLKNINDINNAIKKLDEESKNLDLGSEAFENSKTQIEELKKKLEELSKSQSKLDDDMSKQAEEAASKRAERMERIGNNLQKFAAGLTDAFAGAFIALGAGEEDAKKFNETLQQGLGIAIGVKGGIEALVAAVELAGPAFEAFNAIMAANPIGVVVAAVAALAAGIYLLVKALNAEEKESEKLTKQLERQKNAAELLKAANANEVSILEAKLGLMKAKGASDEKILKAEKELYEVKRKGLQQELLQLELSTNITKARLQESLAEQSLTEAYYRKAAATAKALGQDKEANLLEMMANKVRLDDSKEITDQLQKDLTAVADLKTKLSVLDIQHETFVADVKTKNNEKAADKEKERIKELQKLRDEQLKLEAQELQEQLDNYNKYLDEQKALLQKQREEELDDDDNFYANKHSKAIKAAQNALIGDEDNLAKQRKLLDEQRQEEIRIAQQTGEDIAAINRKYAEADEKLVEESFKKKVATVNQYTQAVGTALNSVIGVFQAYAELQKQEQEQEAKERQEALDIRLQSLNETRDAELAKEGLTNEQKTAINQKYAQQEYELKLSEYNRNTDIKKKAFEQDKKLKIAQTVIATITGAVAAFTGSLQSIPAPYGLIVGALSAAAVTAMGAIQVAQISKQKFDAGTPPAAPKIAPQSSNVGDSSAGSGAQNAPKLYSIGQGDENTGVGGSGKREAQPIKAYVVSQEVTSSQNMNSVIERRASF